MEICQHSGNIADPYFKELVICYLGNRVLTTPTICASREKMAATGGHDLK
jgi:hypothetical protein